MKGHLDVKQLENYKKEDLQALARELGVSDEGTKAEIAARCAEVEVDIPDESELTDEEKAVAEQAAKEAAAEQKAKEETAKAAGKVKVEAVKHYLDKQLNQIKDAGNTFYVDKARADELVNAKVAKIVE